MFISAHRSYNLIKLVYFLCKNVNDMLMHLCSKIGISNHFISTSNHTYAKLVIKQLLLRLQL